MPGHLQFRYSLGGYAGREQREPEQIDMISKANPPQYGNTGKQQS